MLTIRCGSGPSDSSAQSSSRSAVAGTWTVTLTSGANTCGGLLHLAGPDLALTGAWTGDPCYASGYNYIPSGPVSGELAQSKLRLNLENRGNGSNNPEWILLDVTLGADGKSATGTAVGGKFAPASCTGSGGHCSVSLAQQ